MDERDDDGEKDEAGPEEDDDGDDEDLDLGAALEAEEKESEKKGGEEGDGAGEKADREPADDLDTADDAQGTDPGAADGKSAARHPPRARGGAAQKVGTVTEVAMAHRDVILVADEDRVTSNVLQVREMARVLSIRAAQIQNHPNAFVDVTGLDSALEMAKKELSLRRCPLLLRRPVGYGPRGERVVEVWRIREMAYPPIY